MTRKLRLSGSITASAVEIFEAGVQWNLVDVMLVNPTSNVRTVTLQAKQLGADGALGAAVEILGTGTVVDNDSLEWAPLRAFYLMVGDTLEVSADSTGCKYHINLEEA